MLVQAGTAKPRRRTAPRCRVGPSKLKSAVSISCLPLYLSPFAAPSLTSLFLREHPRLQFYEEVQAHLQCRGGRQGCVCSECKLRYLKLNFFIKCCILLEECPSLVSPAGSWSRALRDAEENQRWSGVAGQRQVKSASWKTT